MIKVTQHIIFDLDGTLTKQSVIFQKQAQAVADKFGTGAKREQEIIEAFYYAHDKAVANFPEHRSDITWYMQEMSLMLGVSISSSKAKEMAQKWVSAHKSAMESPVIFDDVLENLKRLKNFGCALYLASGNTIENRQNILNQLSIASYFDKIFAAQTVGFQKQDKRFWEAVLLELKIPAEQITVVGNQLNDDILHPKTLGMKTVLIKRESELIRTEKKQSIIPDFVITTLKKLHYE